MDAAVDELMSVLPARSVFEISAAVAGAEAICGEAIIVKDIRQPAGRFGMCARTGDGHVIAVSPDLSGDLRCHTVLHELGHILLGHNDAPIDPAVDRLTALLIGATVVHQTCSVPQSRLLAQREDDAERFATTVGRRWRRGMTSRHLSRLDEVFG